MSRTYVYNLAKIGLVTLALATALALAFVPAARQASAATVAELTAQINALLAEITKLQAQLATIGGTTANCNFTRDLFEGVSGDDVMCLQRYLNSAGFTLASTGAGSPGSETTFFGSRTRAAVSAWQAANGVSPTAGYFGPISRAKYNALMAVGPTPTPTPTPVPGVAGTLMVAAGVQPANSLAPYNSARVPFTSFTLTAGASDVTVDGVTIERTGLAADTNFTGVLLLNQDGTILGLEKTMDANHQAVVGGSFTVPAGQSRTYTVAANMDTAANVSAGQVASFTVRAVNTSATVSGSLPITGASHTINATLAIGSVTVTALSHSSITKEVGTKDFTFGSFRLEAGSVEKVRLNWLRWNQVGSAGKDDIKDMVTLVDSVAYPSTVTSDGKYYVTTFPGGILIDKGKSVEIAVRGTIDGGSGRTIILDIYRRSDLGINGDLYGYGITPPNGSATADRSTNEFTSGNPWLNGMTTTIAGGSMTIEKAGSVPAQNVAVNASDQILGGFDVEVKGESITVAQIDFYFGMSVGDAGDLTNVVLVGPSGNTVAGPNDGGATTNRVRFSSSINFPIGRGTYTLKGKIGTDITNNGTIQASTTPGTDWANNTKGNITGNSITPTPATSVTANTVTVKTAVVTVSILPTPIAQTVVAGSRFTFANYEFDTGQSGDNVKFSSIPLAYGRATGTPTNLTSCALFGPTGTQLTTGSNTVNPTATASSSTFTFDSPYTFNKQTVTVLSLSCMTAATSSSTDIHQWGIDSGATFSAVGVDSGTALSGTSGITVNDSSGQQITLSTGGTWTVVDDSTPGYTVVTPGTTVTLLKLKFAALQEDIDIRRVNFQLTSNASNTPLDLVGSQITLWDGSKQIGTAVFANNADYATSSLVASGDFRVPKGSSRSMTIKGVINNLTESGPLTASGDLVIVSWDANAVGISGGNYGVGAAGGTNINPTTASDVSPTGVRIMRSYPSFTKLDLSASERILQNGGDKTLYKFKARANNGDVYIAKFTFSISSSTHSQAIAGATTSLFSLYAYTESSFSVPDSTFSASGLLNSGQCFNNQGSTAAGKVNSTHSSYPLEIWMEKTQTICNTATTTYKIPSGEERWFVLRATLAGVESISDFAETINVQLDGDAAYPVTSNTLMLIGTSTSVGTTANRSVDDDTNDDFIWSPNSTSTTNDNNDLDWTNGYSLPGLPTINMAQETLTSL